MEKDIVDGDISLVDSNLEDVSLRQKYRVDPYNAFHVPFYLSRSCEGLFHRL